MKYSVLMSVYIIDKAEYLKPCIESSDCKVSLGKILFWIVPDKVMRVLSNNFLRVKLK